MAAEQSCYYVTTPIYYANGQPHIGNTYTTTLADSLNRFYRFLGKRTFFLTGTDEHGDKVSQSAAKAGKTPFEFTTDVSNLFKATWSNLGLEYSRFIRTTDDDHRRTVHRILQKIYAKGDIYFGEYGGDYCYGCERFLTEKELVDGKCPQHQVPPVFIKEKNYFFRMSKYQEQLIRHLTEGPHDFIRPERYKNEVLAMLREPLEDLCISRPKSRLTWGIELPFDSAYVTYVWFDALINYLTGAGYPDGDDFEALWSNCEHIIAKDILKPHGVFWPTMLMAADIPLYRHLSVHGYWNTPTGKMSKSLGNVVDPVAVKDEFGMDVFRYYVFREMAFGLDGVFSLEALENRYNSDLANNLGNLVSRSLAMVHRYRGGRVPKPKEAGELEKDLSENASRTVDLLVSHVSRMEIHRGIERIWQFIDSVNVYIDRSRPWVLAKEAKESAEADDKLDTVLYHLAEAVRVVGVMLTAFMPDKSRQILHYLGFDDEQLAAEQTVSAARAWGRFAPDAVIGKVESLFPRTDLKIQAPAAKSESKQEQVSPEIDYADFAKLDLRVGQILSAEKIEKSEKLLRLQVDLGDIDHPRQIVAGIAKHYSPEELIGRKVVVVANLKPIKLMGHSSKGMLLAASDDQGNLELLNAGPALAAGSIVR